MRVARDFTAGVVYHLIARFVDRSWFITCDEERKRYLTLLGRAVGESDWRCLAYAVMSSHIHLMMLAGWMTLESWAKRVHSPFAQWMNERHERIGPMFTRGPKAIAVLPESEANVLAYIHNNPVRAGVVKHASDSTWTSHRAYVGLARPPEWLDVAEGFRRVDIDDPTTFDAWVNDTPGESGHVDLRRVREKARKQGAIEVATPTAGPIVVVPLVARSGAHIRVEPRRIVQLTAAMLQLSELDICSGRHDSRVTVARVIAVRAAYAVGVSGAAIARCIGVSPQAVSRLRRREVPPGLQEVHAVVLARVADEARARRAS